MCVFVCVLEQVGDCRMKLSISSCSSTRQRRPCHHKRAYGFHFLAALCIMSVFKGTVPLAQLGGCLFTGIAADRSQPWANVSLCRDLSFVPRTSIIIISTAFNSSYLCLFFRHILYTHKHTQTHMSNTSQRNACTHAHCILKEWYSQNGWGWGVEELACLVWVAPGQNRLVLMGVYTHANACTCAHIYVCVAWLCHMTGWPLYMERSSTRWIRIKCLCDHRVFLFMHLLSYALLLGLTCVHVYVCVCVNMC